MWFNDGRERFLIREEKTREYSLSAISTHTISIIEGKSLKTTLEKMHRNEAASVAGVGNENTSLWQKLDHPNVDIKRRTMTNILNKFKYGLMSVEMYETNSYVLISLLKWFNNNPCFYYRQVIQLLSEFAKVCILRMLFVNVLILVPIFRYTKVQ